MEGDRKSLIIFRRMAMSLGNMINPLSKFEDGHPIWYWLALSALSVAVVIAFCVVGPTGYGNKNYLAIKPGMTSILMASVFMTALMLRGCIKLPEHPLMYLLLVGDMLVFASFLEIVCAGTPVELFKMPWWLPFKNPAVTPRFLAGCVIVLTFIGARAIAGLGVILLAFVTLIHIMTVNSSLESRGVVFVIASYLSLLFQIKIPGMHIDKKLSQAFLEDLGRGARIVGNEAIKDVRATKSAAVAGTKLAARGVAAYMTGGASELAAADASNLCNHEEKPILKEIRIGESD